MSLTIDHKKGDSFEVSCSYADDGGAMSLYGIDIKSQFRTDRGAFVSECDVVVTDWEAGLFTLTVADTTGWTIGKLEWDIQYSFDSTILSTETITVNVLKDVTRP